ncbi:hypothetical protein BOTBODRAFT_82779, partial [Botryobasidium botryosum FD-172 SS1]
DARDSLKMLDLEPTLQDYMCCPRCFEIYDLPSNSDDHPQTCTSQKGSAEEPCGACLTRLKPTFGKGPQIHPLHTYSYQRFGEWLGRLICRHEATLDLAKDWVLEPEREVWSDVWHAPALRQFMGPDDLPFFSKDTDEGRYAFGLFVDWFSPFWNKVAGKKFSVGVVFMVCLNLPPEIRYKLENLYVVAIIPGPKEPSLDEINPMLRPIVDDLIRSWDSGFFFTRTPAHPRGRTCRSALVPLIADLPAARKTAGFLSHSGKRFCAYCGLSSDDCGNIDPATWTSRTDEEHRKLADQWRELSTLAARESFAKQHGVRWSELLRLTYWKPILWTIIDIMHCIYLGLYKRHCWEIWGMGVKDASGDGGDDPVASRPDRTKVLGKEVLAEIRKDRDVTELPSWVERVPLKLGDPSEGSLGADEWRITCEVHLVITLIRLWGHNTGRYHQLLENFMHLVTAGRYISMRHASISMTDDYLDHMLKYLRGLKELFPECELRPYQHLALHIPDFWKRFGPVRSWWSFPFERYNRMMRKYNTNNHLG